MKIHVPSVPVAPIEPWICGSARVRDGKHRAPAIRASSGAPITAIQSAIVAEIASFTGRMDLRCAVMCALGGHCRA